MIKNTKNLLIVSVLLSAFWGCSGSQSTDNGENKGNDTISGADTTQKDDEMKQDEGTAHLLPSPLQIAYIFKKSGLKYVSGTTLDPKKQSDFATSYSQSLGLGVYSSDLAYCVLNKQNNEARNYMNAVKGLTDKLGMSTVFDSDALLKRFDANLGNEDSIMVILSDIQSKSDEFFSSNDREMSAAIVFSGAWVESMYIASKVLPKTKDSKLGGQLADQMAILENLLKELKIHESKEPKITDLLADLNAVHDIIAGIPGVKEMMDSDKPTDVKIEASEQQLKDLAKKVEDVREKIIKG